MGITEFMADGCRKDFGSHLATRFPKLAHRESYFTDTPRITTTFGNNSVHSQEKFVNFAAASIHIDYKT